MTWRVWLVVVLGTVLSNSVNAGEPEVARARFVWADFDGDGLEDVYVVRREGQDSLFRNLGDGSFEDVTAQALPCVSCASMEVAWRDVDQDERPDLLRLLASGGVELLRNRGDGMFEDVTAAAGLDRVVGASAGRWLDYDADGRPDLELATETDSLLFHNLGAFLFESVTFVDLDSPPAPAGATPVRAIPGALDGDESSLPVAEGSPLDVPTSGSRRAGGDAVAALSGSLIDKVHPDPFMPGTPPVDPLEPNPEVEFQIPPFANRCAWSVRDTSTGDCVMTSTLPTLGKLYPLSVNLFVSTGGDVGIGTISPTAKLDVAGKIRSTGFQMPTGASASRVLASDASGNGTWQVASGGVAGSGTAGNLPRFITGGTIGDSIVLQDMSNNIGIGATSPGAKFNVAGTARIANKLTLNPSGDTALDVSTGSIYKSGMLFIHTKGGINNTAVGNRALDVVTTGYDNTALGNFALVATTTGDHNTALGDKAMLRNTTGRRNTAIGNDALYSNTFGNDNTAIGYRALVVANGTRNTAIGGFALGNNTTGYSNTASGVMALYHTTTGKLNTASGDRALFANTVGSQNTASGYRALYSNNGGLRNTASGNDALRSNTTGADNIALGYRSGYYLTTGNNNIAIGNAGVAAEGATIRLGTSGTHTRAFIAGIRGVTTVVADAIPVLIDSAGQLGTVSSSRRFKKDVSDMGESTDRLLELRPVVFRYKQEQKVPSGDIPVEYGLIAEEVAEVFPDLVVYDEQGEPFTVKYHLLASMLLNELKKNDARDRERERELERELAELREELTNLKAFQPRALPASAPASDR